MTVIYVKNKKWDCGDEAAIQGCTNDEWMAAFCPEKTCSVCGEDIWERNFILWQGVQGIVLCDQCAEHTLAGLNRDLCELKGEIKRIKTGYVGSGNPRFNVSYLTENIEKLRLKNIEYVKQILELQDIIARRG